MFDKFLSSAQRALTSTVFLILFGIIFGLIAITKIQTQRETIKQYSSEVKTVLLQKAQRQISSPSRSIASLGTPSFELPQQNINDKLANEEVNSHELDSEELFAIKGRQVIGASTDIEFIENNSDDNHSYNKSELHIQELKNQNLNPQALEQLKADNLLCHDGFAENCYYAALAINNVTAQKRKLLEKACTLNRDYCGYYGLHLQSINETTTALTIFNRSCKAGDTASCNSAGYMLESKSDLKGANNFYNLSCAKGDNYGCYRQGLLLEQLNLSGHSLITLACFDQLNSHPEACLLLGKQYKNLNAVEYSCAQNKHSKSCEIAAKIHLSKANYSKYIDYLNKGCFSQKGDLFEIGPCYELYNYYKTHKILSKVSKVKNYMCSKAPSFSDYKNYCSPVVL